ncbi:MAG: small multi-drug export protein [Planctomycetota bacterium]|jgi:uncharacterized membrane protein
MKSIRRNNLRFIGSVEAFIFWMGLCQVGLWIAAYVVTALYAPGIFTGMLKQVGAHALGGRLAGITAGITAGLGVWLVVAIALATDLTLVSTLYPLIIYSYERKARRWFMRGTVQSTIEAAQSGQKRVRRWGIVGIVFFVWFPFYTTGPLVGAVIGYFLRLRAWVTLVAVGVGTLLAIVSWTAASDPFLEWLKDVAPGLLAYIPWIIVAIVLAGVAVAWIHRRVKRPAASTEPPSDRQDPDEETSDAA